MFQGFINNFVSWTMLTKGCQWGTFAYSRGGNEFCGKSFVPRSGMQKYSSDDCQAAVKRLRKKRP